MKRVLCKLEPMETVISGKTIEVYNLNDIDPGSILAIRVGDDSQTELDELAKSVSEIINVPCLIVPHRVEFLSIRKLTLWQRAKSFIQNIFSGKK